MDELIDYGKSTKQIYPELKKVSTNTVRETVCLPKLINSQKFAKKKRQMVTFSQKLKH